MARGRWAAAVAVLLLVVQAGCGLSRPRWLFPGSIARQQDRAVVHDPYADNQAGPAVVGGRPRDYAQQLPEAERAQPRFLGPPPGTWFTP